jgi:hypothetical protein
MSRNPNIAYRTGRIVKWNHAGEQVIGDFEANRLAFLGHRAPWRLPAIA